ncbi:ROK family transcriptional regulator [Kineococcus gypseus]|uniref:ROK family transcriptional regulator n=1 Tax=Kineococcus gypseus TaxID=1637102 RepID=UPI003D7E3EB2
MSLPTGAGGLSSTLQLLRDGKPRTRAELAQLTGQARSTISQRVDQLLAAHLVAPTGGAVSTGGRPPATFAFNPSARVVLAVDLGATHARVAVTDLAATVLAEEQAPVAIGEGPEAVLDLVAATGHRLLAAAGRSVPEVVGVGVGLPGPVDHATGRPANPPIMPGWHDADVRALVRERLGPAPVLVDNDVNVMALGEHATEHADVPHLLFVKVATGIGAGLISDGHLLRGAQGAAGDLGHVVVPGNEDVPCRCGNNGCLEAVAGGRAIAAELTRAGLAAADGPGVVALVNAGDVRASAAVREAGRALGRVLATCVSLLNPSVIVVGGSLAGAGEQLLAGVREAVYQRSLPLATQHLRILASRAGARAGVLGASTMVIEHVLSGDLLDGLA